jgi:hypothetical protein
MFQRLYTIFRIGIAKLYIKALSLHKTRLWPVIDEELRSAAFDRQIHVRLLMSRWSHTNKDIYPHLHSLAALNNRLPCRRYKDPTSAIAF